ncbi:bestrophin family protein [Methylobacterium sp. E-025]|uniref:bestrophin family protein n=1 Tax=unclassified Methylobacterium TaxID=2615210 RepID=UPI001FBA698A|nr:MULTISPECIES: bestrophin family protein [unclassified Methylobacterium]MCJ2005891.1 bestrophin family protein [Methylobacterium sp. J-092]MCJ2041469.1 bestrophin family protein [Methylobacterium sp. J-059]MCJ2110098.1 bestrophin family protein [Methylobacterium sp. E-025]
MIVRPRPNLFAILFTLRGSILPRVALKVLGLTAFAALVVAVEQRVPERFPVTAGIGPFTLIGLALSIFLSFRNNACYERWWEARKAWGALIVEMRGLSRTLVALLPGPEHDAVRRTGLRRLAGFGHGLHARLRGLDEAAAVAPWLPPGEVARLRSCPSPTDAVLAGLTRDLAGAYRDGHLTDVLFGVLERKVSDLSAIHTACERIHGTPLPFAYTLLLYRTAWLYCLLLPFGLSASLGWATPVATMLVAYTFFGLDALGDELEEPFGLEANDLPLDAMLRTAERTVLDALGEPLPPAMEPVRYRLD